MTRCERGSVDVAYVDQGYTGEAAAEQARQSSIKLEIGDRQTSRSQTGICAVAETLGGGTNVRLAGPLSPIGSRLRTTG
jgi:hypothetical protein